MTAQIAPPRLLSPAMTRPSLPSRPAWRTAGCGYACSQIRATPAGGSKPLTMDLHDPAAHEQAGVVAGQRTGRTEGMAALLFLAPRPARPANGPSVVATGGLVVDLGAATVTVDGEAVPSPPVEWEILRLLTQHVGTLVTRERLLAEIWPDGLGRRAWTPLASRDPYHPLRMATNRLRRRLGPAGQLIETRAGIGYLLRAASATDAGATHEKGG